jgi:hypothetical protein
MPAHHRDNLVLPGACGLLVVVMVGSFTVATTRFELQPPVARLVLVLGE